MTDDHPEYGQDALKSKDGLVRRNGSKNSIEEADASAIVESGSTNGSTTNEKSNLTAEGNEARGKWTNGLEFLLSCISMSVGLGNVWRFPYVAYQNGGGAFLIPYLLLLFVVGRPIYYMEMIAGQFSGRGPIKMFESCVPALKGVGFAQLISVSYVAIFYNYLMGISLFYFFASFTSQLPWTVCNDAWLPASAAGFCAAHPDATNFENQTWAELYYKRGVLNESLGLWDINSISWKLVLCLLAAWTIVYLSIVKGVTSLGKVAYFTAIFPYVVLVALLVVSLTQKGALEGIAFFFTPKFEKLLDPIVWYRAVEQSFFSLAVCFGSLVMYSSYNDFHNNVNRDCLIISLLDTGTSLLAGCVIFAVLGNMAYENNESIEDVVKDGPGLAFIAYPEGLSKIKFVPQLWSCAFFLMLITLGIGSSVSMVETTLTCIKDQYKGLHNHKGKTAAVCCGVYFLFGLPLTTDAGTYIMSLLDNYGVGTAAFLYGILEVVGLMWVYGLKNFCLDAQFMLRNPVSIIWKITWGFVTPFVLIVIFIYGNVIIFKDHKGESEQIPLWGTGIGWALAAVALLQIPLWFTIGLARQKGTSLGEKLRLQFTPKPDYGPIEEKTFREWSQWKMVQTGGGNIGNGGDFTDIDNNYSANKSSLFIKSGADNLAFVQEESASKSASSLTFGGSLGTSSHPDSALSKSNASFKQPQLLSSRSFVDNY